MRPLPNWFIKILRRALHLNHAGLNRRKQRKRSRAAEATERKRISAPSRNRERIQASSDELFARLRASFSSFPSVPLNRYGLVEREFVEPTGICLEEQWWTGLFEQKIAEDQGIHVGATKTLQRIAEATDDGLAANVERRVHKHWTTGLTDWDASGRTNPRRVQGVPLEQMDENFLEI